MVPKPVGSSASGIEGFRAVLFRMVPKPMIFVSGVEEGFRAVLFRMVPKPEPNACGSFLTF